MGIGFGSPAQIFIRFSMHSASESPSGKPCTANGQKRSLLKTQRVSRGGGDAEGRHMLPRASINKNSQSVIKENRLRSDGAFCFLTSVALFLSRSST